MSHKTKNKMHAKGCMAQNRTTIILNFFWTLNICSEKTCRDQCNDNRWSQCRAVNQANTSLCFLVSWSVKLVLLNDSWKIQLLVMSKYLSVTCIKENWSFKHNRLTHIIQWFDAQEGSKMKSHSAIWSLYRQQTFLNAT